MPPLHVLIASVPERAENLRTLIDDLHAQTRVPDTIVCYLNGYPTLPVLPGVVRDYSDMRRSAGSRWQYVESPELSKDTILCVIDDDFRLERTYLETTIAALTPSVGMVAWTGHPTRTRYHFLESLPRAISLQIGGVGACAVRVGSVRGVTGHPLAPELFGMGGDDELLISLWLRQRNEMIVRPAGKPPITSVDALQYASTASHQQHRIRWQQRRHTIMQEYNWV